jgi:serine/threonine protein kinase
VSAPERIGRLRRVRLLGTGAFASVWLYHDPELDSDVAVKLLADNWAADPETRDRFLEESRLLRRVSSPHLVSVFDLGVTDAGTPYFVMSYADGGSVADLLTGAGRDPDDVLDIVTQAADGVAALHQRGIVHRDLKPANLLLTTDPDGRRRVLVSDLGVAKSLAAADDTTTSVGTPAYSAPEQWELTGSLDARADVYALGAVTWALFAGRAPRRRQHRAEPMEPLAAVRQVGDQLDYVVRRAVATDPDHRWPDVATFAGALAQAHAGSLDDRPEPRHTDPRPPKTRATTAIVVAAASAIMVSIAAVVVLLGPWSDNAGNFDDGKDAFRDAAIDYITMLQDDDCEGALYYADPATTAEELCDSIHHHLADQIDTSGPTRVEMIGDNRARVVFVDQGYIEVIRGDDTLFEMGYFSA